MERTIDITRLPLLPDMNKLNGSMNVAFSPDGKLLAVVGLNSPLELFTRDGMNFKRLPVIQNVTEAMTFDAAFSPDGDILVQAHDALFGQPALTFYRRNGNSFTLIPGASADTLEFGPALRTKFSPDGEIMVVSHIHPPRISIFSRSGDTFNLLSGAIDVPLENELSNDIAFTPDGNIMALVHSNNIVSVHSRSGNTFTQLPDLMSSVSAGAGIAVDFSPGGELMVVASKDWSSLDLGGSDIHEYITVFRRNGTDFTKISDIAKGLPRMGFLNSLAFSPDGSLLAVAHETHPSLRLYSREGEIFTKLPNPEPPADVSAETANEATALNFSPDGKLLAIAHGLEPFVTVYEIDYGDTGGGNGSNEGNGGNGGNTTVPARPFSIRKLIIFEPDGTIREVIS